MERTKKKREVSLPMIIEGNVTLGIFEVEDIIASLNAFHASLIDFSLIINANII